MRNRLLVCLAALPSLAAVPAWAQGRVNEQDRQFVQQAAASGQEEVAEGRLAEQQASTPAVREFGRWMVTDHTLMNNMLKARASHAGIQVPQSSSKAETKVNELRNSSHFDTSYITGQVMAHEQAVALFEKEERQGENPGLKSLARMSLPILGAHLTEARDLQSHALENAPPGTRASVPSGAAPATTTQNTGATNQPPAVKQMNQEGMQKIEKEGK